MPATSMKPVECALAIQLVMMMRDMSLAAELCVVQDKRTNAIGLLSNGHIDTNPVSEGWIVDPWDGRNEGSMLLLSRALICGT